MTEPIGGAFPRRQFLKGAGAAAGALVVGGGARAQDATTGPRVRDAGAGPVRLRVNGREHVLALEPRVTLAEALRLHLGLTGTKVGCDRGACSACTVWLDGTPVNACMTLAIEVGEREVTTIEGLARGDALHPVQACFIEKDALQCGYCTPGMIMSCAALLARTPQPSLDDVRAATSGNLCRCGTYPKVFEATLEAAKRHGR
jgi:xanthine dehydrogenase YagT iron-sulfur-binding subunit